MLSNVTDSQTYYRFFLQFHWTQDLCIIIFIFLEMTLSANKKEIENANPTTFLKYHNNPGKWAGLGTCLELAWGAGGRWPVERLTASERGDLWPQSHMEGYEEFSTLSVRLKSCWAQLLMKPSSASSTSFSFWISLWNFCWFLHRKLEMELQPLHTERVYAKRGTTNS